MSLSKGRKKEEVAKSEKLKRFSSPTPGTDTEKTESVVVASMKERKQLASPELNY